LLQEFEDIFHEDIPNELPRLRKIEHQIDLVHGAIIPNQPVYRCNPEERKEPQVNELMEKRCIHKSMSLCVMPLLLVPKKDEI